MGTTVGKLILALILTGCARQAAPSASNAPAPPAPAAAPADAPPSDVIRTASAAPAVEPQPTRVPTEESARNSPEPAAAPDSPAPLPEGTTVLHIGDSMAGALGVALNEELKRHKIKGVLHFKAATFIPGWAWGKDLPLYLAQLKPDLVVITLGTNEVKMIDPSVRAPTIRKLVGLLGGKPCVWIAPPLWAGETELYRVLRENVAPCRYMDTNLVYPEMPRLNDKIHPTIPARKEWAKRVVAWLAHERRPTPGQPWHLVDEIEPQRASQAAQK